MEYLWNGAEEHYRTRLLETLPRDPDARVLDVGCDDGAWTERVRSQVRTEPARVFGLEIVQARAELARARGFRVSVGDLDEQWPFEDASVDIVHANQVIEHVQRLDHFVSETRRVLVPDGVAVVCTENLASWHNIAALALGLQPFSLTNISDRRPIGNPLALHAGEAAPNESMQHVHVVAFEGLRDIFAAHGFRIEKAWGAGYHPFPPALARPMARIDPRHAHFLGILARRPA
jgi:SAM-dependent methyltransferase